MSNDIAGMDVITKGEAPVEFPEYLGTESASTVDYNPSSEGSHPFQVQVPEGMEDKVVVDMDSPMAQAAMAFAAAKGMSQDDFNDLTSAYFNVADVQPAADQPDFDGERKKLVDTFDEGGRLSPPQALARAQEIGNWAVGLLADELKTSPDLIDELSHLTSTADGVRLLKSLRDNIGESRPPKSAALTPGGRNPFARDQFNLTEQARIARENPALAARMKAQAG